jgi:hypothetical protein
VTTPAVSRRGELLPAFPRTKGDRSAGFVERYRGQRNLVIVFAADIGEESPVSGLLQQLRLRAAELTAELAQVLVIVTSPQMAARHGSIGFPTLLDEGGQIHRALVAGDAAGRLGPAVFVTDRFREIFAAYLPGQGSKLPGAQEILDWLVFINIQCPECGVPEWAP